MRVLPNAVPLAAAASLLALAGMMPMPVLAQAAAGPPAALVQAMAAIQAADTALAALQSDKTAARGASDPAFQKALGQLQSRMAALSAPGAAAPAETCRSLNTRLLTVAHDILHLYESQSFRALLVRSYEPLLGLWRVELENLVQDMDEKIRDLECLPETKGPAQ